LKVLKIVREDREEVLGGRAFKLPAPKPGIMLRTIKQGDQFDNTDLFSRLVL